MPPTPQPPRETSVLIIGSGLAGLTTAYLLTLSPRPINITIFESSPTPSLDSASITLRSKGDNTLHRVDLPMRSFAGGYYHNLQRLYDRLCVRYQEQQFLFTFASNPLSTPSNSLPELRRGDSKQRPPPEPSPPSPADDQDVPYKPYFHHPSNLPYLPPKPSGISYPSHIFRTLLLLLSYLHFTLCIFFAPPSSQEPLGAYLARIHCPQFFIRSYLLPLLSAVSTCSHAALLESPASDVAGYKRLTHRQPHLSVSGGVMAAQEALVSQLKSSGNVDFKLSSTVLGVNRPNSQAGGEGVEVQWLRQVGARDGGQIENRTFDRVILATPPNVTGRIFAPLRAEMDKIPTAEVTTLVLQPNPPRTADVFEVVAQPTYTSDEKTVPTGKGTSNRGETEEEIVLLTCPRLGTTEANHRIPSNVHVVTCPLDSTVSASSRALVHKASFTRVLRTVTSREVVNRIFGPVEPAVEEDLSEKSILLGGDGGRGWRNGDGGVYLVGGWCWDGMVLLEGCVVSALRVAGEFGVERPWEG